MRKSAIIAIILAAAVSQAQLTAKVQRKVKRETPTQHQVALTWTQSSTPGITSNNVYRGTTSGGPYTLIYSSTSPITSYTDTTVNGGTTYYYVVTALINSEESGYSNEYQANVPAAPTPPTGLTGTAQ